MNRWIISGIILLVGFFICLFLILRNKWKAGRKNINDYEEGRDKLTYRKKKEESEVDYSDYIPSGISVSSIVTCFITIFIGVSLIGPVTEQVNSAMNTSLQSNATIFANSTFSSPLLYILPGVFALAVAVIAISLCAGMFRNNGLV